ncbi:MAG: helix-turn-helix transcriptional regulator [Clostridia bacterium]|nr:helix-turn-helix transcriptional regulator [Clostridia bacterium]
MGAWIAEVIGKMHVHKITQTALAEHMGVRRDYISRVLNGGRNPSEETAAKIVAAVDEMIAEKA